MSVRLAAKMDAGIGESPLWQDQPGRVVWTDPLTRRLLYADGAGAAGSVALDESLFSIAALPDGGIAGATATCLCRVGAARGVLAAGPAAPLAPGVRFNDMAVDALGGIWAGAMHGGVLAASGSLYYAAGVAQRPRQVFAGLGVPNGMAFSHDGTILYLIDTLARTLLAFAADVRAGTLSQPVIVSDFMNIPGKPDGMTIAADGSLWVAMWGGSCVVRLAPDGALLALVKVPAPHVSSACFGPDGTLFVSTSRMRLGPQQLAEWPDSGSLFAIAALA